MSDTPKLSRYAVLGRLAAGGMAEVWLARALGVGGFEKLVVLKTILKNLADDTHFVQMFINEARLAAMLNHPNCVQIFDLGQENGTLYIAMEYIEGFSFARIMKRAKEKGLRIPVEIVARVMMDTASGLEYAHRLTDREGRHLQLVHRDVSPDNVLVSFSGQAKLVDFGVAKAATSSHLAATSAGMVKGKLGYIAPEYLRGEPIDGRADLFALGVVFYRALVGRRPFLGPNELAVSRAVLQDTPPSPSELVPTVPPALSAAVMTALDKQPATRFESARAMRDAIEAAVGRPASNEAVGDYMNQLWPAGDPDRVALHALATGASEETSSPLLSAVNTGSGLLSTPSRSRQAQATSTGISGVRARPVELKVTTDGKGAPRIELPPLEPAPTQPEPFAAPPEPVAKPAPVRVEPPAPVRAPVVPPEPAEEDAPPRSNRTWLVVAAVALLAVIGGVLIKLKVFETAPAAASSPEKKAEPMAAGAGATMGHLSVKTEPAVKVLEGKKELGTSPLELDLEPGPHTLRLVARPGIDQTVTVTLTAGETTAIEELARGSLAVKASPWAYVKLDGKSLGQTPIAARQVYEGLHVVELSNTQLHETRRVEVRVKAGETKTVTVDLEAEE